MCEKTKLRDEFKRKAEYWRYLGYKKEELDIYEQQVSKDNFHMFKQLLPVTIVLLCFGCMVVGYMLLTEKEDTENLCFTLAIIVTGILLMTFFQVLCRFAIRDDDVKAWQIKVMTTLFLAVWSLMYIINGTLNNRESYATMVCGSFLLIQMVFDAYPCDNLIFTSSSFLFFGVLCFFCKDHSIFIYDIVNSLTFFLVGNYLSWRKSHSKWTSLINADARVELEKEKMKNQINQNSISIMLSQIQPHFLYNALGTIAVLCDKDPQQARQATLNFSEYIRGNMNALTWQKPIPFEKELEHLKAYLSLEKIRFGEMLHIVYEIKTTQFMLPALTVQPIVENAVKYGVGMAENGGTVTIMTRENAKYYMIIVKDNGVGFDPKEPKYDGRTHIGIENVSSRLEMMVGGKLRMRSKKGVGTVMMIYVPKEKESDNEYISSR